MLVNAVPAILQSLCESLGWQAGIIWSGDDEANVLHRMSSWYSSDLEKEPFNQQTIAFNGFCLEDLVLDTGSWKVRFCCRLCRYHVNSFLTNY
ncbi:hypothetical protein [Nostoc sp.]|uniref:hypothetical protein n=1 Tax=Nostoc sp. TaxID=1180 RepID=UPI002FFB1C55